MATRIVCPHCDDDFNVHDEVVGKQVRCKTCEKPFTAEPPGKGRSSKSDSIASSRHSSSSAEEEDRPRRRRDEEDEDERPARKPRKQKGGAPIGLIIGISIAALVLITGGVVALILLGGGEDPDIAEIRRTQGDAAADLAKELKKAAQQLANEMGRRPGQIPFPNPGQIPIQIPNPGQMPDPAKIFGDNPFGGGPDATSPAEALRLLKSADNNAKNRAIRYLVKTEPNGAEQAEIARQLESLQGNNGVFNVETALAKWATKDQVPTLIKIIQDTPFGPLMDRRKECLLGLGRLGDERGIDIIVERMTDAFDNEKARQALDKYPTTAKSALLKHAFHKNGDVRQHVQNVLQRFGATPDEMLPAAATALGSPENGIRDAALEYISKSPVVPAQQAVVARALEGQLNDQNPFKRRDVVKVLGNWATKDNVPALIGLWNQPGAPHNELRQVFVRLKDERGAELIAKQLADLRTGEAAFTALQEMGAEAAGKAVAGLVNHQNSWVRDRSRQLMQQWGQGVPTQVVGGNPVTPPVGGNPPPPPLVGKPDDPINLAIKDLKAPEPAKRLAALDVFLQSQVQDLMRASVMGAIQPLANDPDAAVVDRAAQVVLRWAGPESLPLLIQMAAHEQSKHRPQAMDALARFPAAPNAMQAIASRLLNAGDREHARKVLEQIGAPAEGAVHAAMLSTQDRRLLGECCQILAKIGTRQSGPILQKVMQVANKNKDQDLLAAAQQAAMVCQTR